MNINAEFSVQTFLGAKIDFRPERGGEQREDVGDVTCQAEAVWVKQVDQDRGHLAEQTAQVAQHRRELVGVAVEMCDAQCPFFRKWKSLVNFWKLLDDVLHAKVVLHTAETAAVGTPFCGIADGNMRQLRGEAVLSPQDLSVKDNASAYALRDVQADDALGGLEGISGNRS